MPRPICWTILGAGGLILAILLVCGLVAAGGAPDVPMAGNREPLIAQASGVDKEPFRFAVLGDTQKGLANFDRLVAKVAEERPAFFVHTGDLVSHNDVGHYTLAKRHLAKASLIVPLLITAGNHDIKGGTERFTGHFGPVEWNFTRQQAAFLSVDDAMGQAPGPELEATLKRYENKRIFIFMHVPPFDARQGHWAPKPEFADFLRMVRQYRVAYVFCGHAHGYLRHDIDGTVFIANGVGGDSDSWQYDPKVMATVVEVMPEFSRDHPVEVAPVISLWSEFEHFAVGHVAEAYRGWALVCWPLTAALAGLVAWAGRGLRKARKPEPEAKTTTL